MPDISPTGECSLQMVKDALRRACCQSADAHLLDESDVALLLAGHDMAHEERDLRGDGLLYGRPPGLSHEKMMGGHQLRHLIRPTRQAAGPGQAGGRDGLVSGFASAGHNIHPDIFQ
ncbi:MAG: hypothetical protein WC076_10425 [Terrimicrobiaceae bacterium]